MRTPLLLCALIAIFMQLVTRSLCASEVTQVQESAQWQSFAFNIEDSKCRVGIASVRLSVSTLRPEDGYLVGEYTIEVPLMTSKNDKGRIVLPLKNKKVSDLGANGGVLRGQAISYHEGTTPNAIVCQILPLKNKTILLEITTDDRTLNFKSSYKVSSGESGS
ncbi:MAG: hypothetical protein ACSHYA_00730 [Opitutaceae bacterium]